MKKLTVALLSGGVSSERDVSLKSGAQVFDALDKKKYDVRRYDPKTDLSLLMKEASDIDAALIILHGPCGEDGTVQGMLDLLGIPYQGAGVLGSALAMNKLASKQMYENAGLPTPSYLYVEKGREPETEAVVDRLGLPVVVKPAAGGSSIGMSIAVKAADVKKALNQAFLYDDAVIAEQFIDGTELTGGILGNNELEALPLIEIIPGADYAFFDYEAKYKTGAAQEICPARVSSAITEKAQRYAKTAHKALFCKGYSRTDFILKEDELFVLETNTIPGMTPTSLFPQAAKAAGIDFGQLLDRLISLSLEEHQIRKKYDHGL